MFIFFSFLFEDISLFFPPNIHKADVKSKSHYFWGDLF